MQALDYSNKANWCKLPAITKDVDTFYVYATEYIMGSMAEGAPAYADMNNQEMLEGAEAEFEAYPHMKFATGECDTGVIITWNTEGPKNREVNARTSVLQPGSMSINPLNWKLDDTYAPASMNLGTLWPNEKGELVIVDRGVDAQVFPDRGVVVTHGRGEEMTEERAAVAAVFFGPDGRHGEDYVFFYNNIKATALVVRRRSAGPHPGAGLRARPQDVPLQDGLGQRRPGHLVQ